MANLLAILLLIVSQFFMHEHSVAYSLLLAATGCLGIGFGLTVPALNTFAATFFPNKVDRALLLLNALLGVGTGFGPHPVRSLCGRGNLVGLTLPGSCADRGASTF